MKKSKKTLAAIMALAMVLSVISVPAFADTAQVLTCDTPAHTHTSACYREDAQLICTLSTDPVKKEIKTPVTETVTETKEVVDEETGETTTVQEEVEVTKEVVTYEILPGHTHGADCYAKESTLVCGMTEHTHTNACYTGDSDPESTVPPEEREVIEGENGEITVTPPEELTIPTETKDEDGNVTSTADTTVQKAEDGKLIVNGKEVEGTITAEVTKAEPVSTAIGDKTGETTSKELSRTENDDGTTTVVTEYTTTYTQEVTTGYWVTYTVTYTEPVTYSVEEDTDRLVDVTVDEEGGLTVSGVKEGLTLKGSDGKEYPVTAGEDGKFYVTIGGESYEVKPATAKTDTGYTVSWGLADETASPSYTEEVSVPVALPEGMTIEDDKVVLTKNVTLKNGETEYTIKVGEDGKTYIVDGDKEYEVTLTAAGSEADGYTLSWSYEVVVSGGTTQAPAVQLPENTSVSVEEKNGKVTVTLKGEGDTAVMSQTITEIEGHTVTGSTQTGDVVNVYCKDENGSVYVYVVGANAKQSGDGEYELTYQQVTKVEKPAAPPSNNVLDKVKDDLGHTTGSGRNDRCEFIAIVLPDGSYLNVEQGDAGNVGWLAWGTYDPEIGITLEGNTITLSVTAQTQQQGGGHGHYRPGQGGSSEKKYSYTFEKLEGYTIKDFVYSDASVNTQGDMYDNLILYVSGIVVEDQYGNVQTLTLTAEDGKLESEDPVKETKTGSAEVGGTTQETKTVKVSSLTGNETVVVKTAGGDQVQMTYQEYLEAVKQGEDLELKGVLESTIEPEDKKEDPNDGEEDPDNGEEDPDDGEEDPDDGEEEDPEIPVIPDPEVPLAEEPEEVQIPEDEVPLEELPELEEIADEEVPLEELPELEEIPDDDVPLADVPKTGDESMMWIALTMASGMGLVWLILNSKKREDAAE